MSNRQKRFVLFMALTALFTLSSLGAYAAETQPPKDTVAVVNGNSISQGDLDKEMARFQQQFAARGIPVDEKQLAGMKKNAVDGLIRRELLYEAMIESGVKIDEAASNQEFEKFKGQFPDDATYKNALSSMNMSENELKSVINKEMGMRQFVEKKFAEKATATDEEVKAYYDGNPAMFKQPEQVRASHILIKVDAGADEAARTAARKKLKDIQAGLEKGEDFAALARENSQCPSSAKGGDLGLFARGQMVKPFEDAAFSLENGKVSDIVETNFGYHLIKVTDKRPAGDIAYDDVKNEIKQGMSQQKMQQLLMAYTDELKKDAKIEIMPEPPAPAPGK